MNNTKPTQTGCFLMPDSFIETMQQISTEAISVAICLYSQINRNEKSLFIEDSTLTLDLPDDEECFFMPFSFIERIQELTPKAVSVAMYLYYQIQKESKTMLPDPALATAASMSTSDAKRARKILIAAGILQMLPDGSIRLLDDDVLKEAHCP